MILNILCLIIWIIWLIHGIYCCINKKEVSKIGFICAVIICILYYLEHIVVR